MVEILTPYQFSLNDRRSSAPYVESSQLRGEQGRFVANGIGFEWKGFSLIDAYLRNFAEDVQAYRRQVAEEIVPAIETYMKTYAPWRDRTGQTREGLKAVAVHRDGQGQSDILFGYTTFNGIFLETKTYNGVSYAILPSTYEYFQSLVGGMLREYSPRSGRLV